MREKPPSAPWASPVAQTKNDQDEKAAQTKFTKRNTESILTIGKTMKSVKARGK
jgi:hypothetical protein